jgi:hypothetical protein
VTPAETIQAAIDKLEEILDETGRYGWAVQEATGLPHYTGNPRVWRLDQVGTYGETPEEQSRLVPVYDLLTTTDRSPYLANALVTLHATIDAQLAILEAENRRLRTGRRLLAVNYPVIQYQASAGERTRFKVIGSWWYGKTGHPHPVPVPDTIWVTEEDIHEADPDMRVTEPLESTETVFALARAILGHERDA